VHTWLKRKIVKRIETKIIMHVPFIWMNPISLYNTKLHSCLDYRAACILLLLLLSHNFILLLSLMNNNIDFHLIFMCMAIESWKKILIILINNMSITIFTNMLMNIILYTNCKWKCYLFFFLLNKLFFDYTDTIVLRWVTVTIEKVCFFVPIECKFYIQSLNRLFFKKKEHSNPIYLFMKI